MSQHILAVHSRTTQTVEAIIDFFKSTYESWQDTKCVNQTIKELSALSDKELNDIGIARGDIYSVARGDTTMRRSVDVKHNENLEGWV